MMKLKVLTSLKLHHREDEKMLPRKVKTVQ
jgi:hypothetical protein